MIRKTVLAIATLATLGAAALAPTSASAGYYGHGYYKPYYGYSYYKPYYGYKHYYGYKRYGYRHYGY